MNRPTTKMIVLGAAAALTFSSTTVTAQDIQRFDDQAESDDGGGDVVLPGAPAPEQQEQQEQTTPQATDDSEDEESGDSEAPGSYRISVHNDPQGTSDQDDELDSLLSDDHTALYQGIIPGERDAVDHMDAAREAAEGGSNQITWVGFKPEDERTRVFFQSPRPVEYQIEEDAEAGELVVIFDSAEIPERNFTRFIDASHFDRAVERIEAEETGGGDVQVTFQMTEHLQPSTSVDGEYLYLDFPHDDGSDTEDATADAE